MTKYIAIIMMLLAAPALALDQAKPGDMPPATGPAPEIKIVNSGDTLPKGHASVLAPSGNRDVFEKSLNITKLKTLAVQHRDQVKILDSWARQSLLTIRNKRALPGHDPVITALDMCLRPDAWHEENIVYVQAIPIRQQLAMMVEDPAERERIMKQGTVSPHFLETQNVQMMLQRMAADSVLMQSVNKVMAGQENFSRLIETLNIVPPVKKEDPWLHPYALLGNTPDLLEQAGVKEKLAPMPGYDVQMSRRVVTAFANLISAWGRADAPAANEAISELADALPRLEPQSYPSESKRTLELWYTRTFNGTLIALIYGAATVLFLASAIGNVKKARRPAMILFVLALVCHAAAMGVRWYLAGRIPIQNQFESVLGSALLGCVVGLLLEMRWRNGIMGMAFGFVGFLAMTCCFVAPFVAGKDMGASIGRVAGILSNTIWLYIHVNVVIFSYALIGASFLLGGVYLLAKLWYWINPIEIAAKADDKDDSSAENLLAAIRRNFLSQMDQLNMVILQMAFWTLGLGIILGAVWADVSWGRPWGWDPKETFALVTWIVYLIIVHIRFVAPKTKGDWAAWLSVIGFFVMLFNWIGVNFFLAGLHSYA